MKENRIKPNEPIKKHPKRKQVHLSTKEIEELMNMHMPTYTRRNGAVRRK